MTHLLYDSRTWMLVTCLTIASTPVTAQQDTKQQSAAPTMVSAKAIAEQLGARLQPREDDELRLGMSCTAVLESPDKLAQFGIKGMHSGARVTIARIAPDKIHVEADEIEPVEANGKATLKLDEKGALVAVKP